MYLSGKFLGNEYLVEQLEKYKKKLDKKCICDHLSGKEILKRCKALLKEFANVVGGKLNPFYGELTLYCLEALFDYCEMFGYIHEEFNKVMFKLYEDVLEVAHHNECYKQYWNKRIIRISEVANDFHDSDYMDLMVNYGYDLE